MSQRLYAQLQPVHDSLEHLLQLQEQTPGRGRNVQPEKIHLTLIHFGIISEVIKALPCDEKMAHTALRTYVASSNAILDAHKHTTFSLQPEAVELFGEYAQTLVVTYATTPVIRKLHAQLLSALQHFFLSAGIQDIDAFMAGDSNFKHALSIRPHITIMKRYVGKLPLLALEPIELRVMPFEVDE